MTVFATKQVSQLTELREHLEKLRKQSRPLLGDRNLTSLGIGTGRRLLAGWLAGWLASRLSVLAGGLAGSPVSERASWLPGGDRAGY